MIWEPLFRTRQMIRFKLNTMTDNYEYIKSIHCLRMEIERTENPFHMVICGLNVFQENEIECDLDKRPDIIFLTHLTQNLLCSAQLSGVVLLDVEEIPDRIFLQAPRQLCFIPTQIGYYDGFFGYKDISKSRDLFFPKIDSLLWDVLRQEDDAHEYLIRCSGLALYISPKVEGLDNMKVLLDSPFPGEKEWIDAATDIYQLILTVGHDGRYIHVWGKDEDSLKLLSPSLSLADRKIESSEWFQTHQHELVFDEENALCLVLPT